MDTSHRHFQPPFCPNTACSFHRDSEGWNHVKDGSHHNQALKKRIQRFRCKGCGRRFSSQSFATTYWLKRPELLPRVFEETLSCSGYRQIARILGVAHSTVANLVSRLGRHCLLFSELWRPKQPPDEDLVLEALETIRDGI